jgi:hypothetical protein
MFKCCRTVYVTAMMSKLPSTVSLSYWCNSYLWERSVCLKGFMIECNWVTQNWRFILLVQNGIEENTSVWLRGQGHPVHSAVIFWSCWIPTGWSVTLTHGASDIREYELHDNMNTQFSALDKAVSIGFVSPCNIIYSNKSTNQMHQSLSFIVCRLNTA